MKVLQLFVVIFSHIFFLIVISVKVPQRIAPGDFNDLIQSEVVEEGHQFSINTQSELRNSRQAFHPQSEGIPNSLKSHLDMIEKHLMKEDNWDVIPNLPINTEYDNTIQDELSVLTYLDDIPGHISLQREQKTLHNHPHLQSVGHSTKHQEIIDLEVGLSDRPIQEIISPSTSKLHPPQDIQSKTELSTRIQELKLLHQQQFLELLYREGEIAIKNNQVLYQQMLYSFEMLKNYPQGLYVQGQYFVCDIQKLQAVVENFNSDLITTYLGGIIILFKNVKSRPSSSDLISDGWDILLKELKREIFFPEKESSVVTKSRPLSQDRRMCQLFEPLRGAHISADLIINLYGIDIEEFTFKKAVLSVATGKKRKHQEEASTQEFIHSITESADFRTLASTYMNTDQKKYLGLHETCVKFLISLGTWEIKIPRILLDRITTYFINLPEKIVGRLLLPGPPWTSSQENSTIPHLGFSQRRVHGAIEMMHKQILPAFLAILWLTYQDQADKMGWIPMCQSGWNFLEGFFSSWTEHVLKDPTALLTKSKNRKELNNIDWSNAQSQAHYMKFMQDCGHLTQGPLWCLVHQWYNILDGQLGSRSISRALGYTILPPNQISIQYTYTKHQKTHRHLKQTKKILTGHIATTGNDNPESHHIQKHGRFLCQFWKWEMINQEGFSTEIKNFFIYLEADLFKSFEVSKKLYMENGSSHSGSDLILNKLMVHNAIRTAEDQILPQFLATLLLLYRDQDQYKLWRAVCGCAWDFAKAYFSEWKSLFIERPLEVMVLSNRKKHSEVDWGNSCHSFHYMANHVMIDHTPEKPAWFLVEQWYQTQLGPGGSIYNPLGFPASCPDKIILRRIINDWTQNRTLLNH
ncbi:hypothetical protein DFH28DRAFT_960797 [Melampsora americana]|nr:hypothetical protein DFH28DRAFT_960797 [Melampsora americana]